MKEIAVVGDEILVKSFEWIDAEVRETDIEKAFEEGTDLVVSTRSIHDANSESIKTGIPFLPVEIGSEISEKSRSAGYVGPLVLPKVSACRECLKLRLESKRESQSEYPDWMKEEVSNESYMGFASGFAALEAGRYTKTGEAQTINSVGLLGHDSKSLEIRPVARVPYCPVCSTGREREDPMPEDEGVSELDGSLNKAESVLDPVTGILRSAGELPSDDTRVPYYLIEISQAPFSDASPPEYAAGVAADWQKALMKGMGEGLERYSAAIYKHDEFIEKPYTDISDIAVDPSDLALFSDEQYSQEGFPYSRPEPSDDVEWVEGVSFTRDTGVLVPAEFVHFPFDSTYAPDITTGLCLHGTMAEALTGGLLEVIERDACMRVWLEDRTPPKIEFASEITDPETAELISRVRSTGTEIHASKLTAEVDVPVVGVSLTSDDYPKFAMSTNASLDVEEAFKGALEEAVQSRREISRMDKRGLKAGEVNTSEDHVIYSASRPEGVERFVGEPEIPLHKMGDGAPEKPIDKFKEVRERTEDAGFEVIGADVTPPDIRSAGFEVVRIVVPRSQPLHFGPRMRRLGGDVKVVNDDPHPYP